MTVHTEQRWSAETEQLAAAAMGSESTRSGVVRAILAALAERGLLLPEGGEIYTEWTAEISIDGVPLPGTTTPPLSEAFARERVASHDEGARRYPDWRGKARLMRRSVHVGPWEPVHDDA